MNRITIGALALAAYVTTIIAANIVVQRYGIVSVGFGLMAPAAVFLAGIAFTLRDVIHVTLGRLAVVSAILVGGLLSAMVSPAFALASSVAFLVSEFADFAVFERVARRGWLPAVAASNAVGLVLDSVLFLWLAFGSLAFLPGQIVGKAYMTIAAIVIIAAIKNATEGES